LLVKKVSCVGVLGFALLATGCAMASAPVIPPVALVQNYKAPLDIDYQETQLGTRQGSASTHSILGLFAWGDGSTRAAAQDGGVTTIRSADYEFFTVLGVYSKYTTVVHGE
jgi:hypothetical protein